MERARKIAAGLMVSLLATGSAFAQTSEPFSCPGAPPSRLQQHMLAVVTPGLPPLNIRVTPGFRSERIGALSKEVAYSIVDGPACVDYRLWWKVSSAGVSGWAVEAEGSDYYLTPYAMTSVATAHNGVVGIDDHDIAFRLDSTIAPEIGAAPVAEVPPPPDPDDGLPQFIAPAGKRYTFFDGTQNSIAPRSTLTIYPANGFRPLSAAQGDQLDALRAMIENETASPDVEIPEVPAGHYAAQMMRAGIQYLTLPDGGKGVRYLSYYAQADVPATNGSLYYEFRGFQGENYIRLEVALSASVLPERLNGPYWGENDFHRYGNHATAMLTDLPEDQFTPKLSLLDAMVQTISTSSG